MFSDIDSPTTSFGVNRAFSSRASSPKPRFHYVTQASVVGPTPTLALEPPSTVAVGVGPIGVPPSERERGNSSNNKSIRSRGGTNSTKLMTPYTVCNEYHFDHPMPVVLLVVQGCLFKVHRHFLERDSTFLRGVLSAVQEAQNHPLEIQGVSSREFKSLLDFFYEGMYRSNVDAIPISEWIDLLAAASALRFDRVKDHAIAAIDKATTERPDSVEMLILAEKYGVTRWLRPAYIALCKRPEPLQMKEAERIGSMEMVVRLMQSREEFLRATCCVNGNGIRVEASPPPSPYPWSTKPNGQRLADRDVAEKIIERIFFDGQ